MLYAIVPVKRLVRAKSRLAPVLCFAQRLKLARNFLARTLDVLERYPGAARTIIVSGDAAVLQMARKRNMIALPEPGTGNINEAIETGCRYARARGAGAVLILPTDLPHLTARSLRCFSRRAPTPAIRIAPDRHDSGTNALYLQPVLTGFARYGAGSLLKHRDAADKIGQPAEVSHDAALALDIDVPADLPLLSAGVRRWRRSARA